MVLGPRRYSSKGHGGNKGSGLGVGLMLSEDGRV